MCGRRRYRPYEPCLRDLAVNVIAVFQAAVDDFHGPVKAPLLELAAVFLHGFIVGIDPVA